MGVDIVISIYLANLLNSHTSQLIIPALELLGLDYAFYINLLLFGYQFNGNNFKKIHMKGFYKLSINFCPRKAKKGYVIDRTLEHSNNFCCDLKKLAWWNCKYIKMRQRWCKMHEK